MSALAINRSRSVTGLPCDYTVFDLETTGISIYKCEIIEIGALRVRGDEVTESFSAFVKPKKPIPEEITRLTGITDEAVLSAEPIDLVMPQFLDFVGGDTVLGHNMTAFDASIVSRICSELDLPAFENPPADTLKLSKNLLPDLESHSLAALADYFGISPDNAHRALDDCRTTYSVYLRLKELIPKKKEIQRPEGTADISGCFSPLIAGKKVLCMGAFMKAAPADVMAVIANSGAALCTDSAQAQVIILGADFFREYTEASDSSRFGFITRSKAVVASEDDFLAALQ